MYKLFSLPMHEDDAGAGDGGAAGGDQKSFSQADVDRVVSQRLAREQKSWETKLEERTKQANMTAEEKLKAAAQEAEGKGKAAIEAANGRLVHAEARIVASDLGVPAAKIPYLLKMADLSAAEVDDKGELNAKAVKQAIEAVLKDLPELKGAGAGSANLGGNPNIKGTARDMNSFIRRSSGR